MHVIQGQLEWWDWIWWEVSEDKNPLTAQDTHAFMAFMAFMVFHLIHASSCFPRPWNGSSICHCSGVDASLTGRCSSSPELDTSIGAKHSTPCQWVEGNRENPQQVDALRIGPLPMTRSCCWNHLTAELSKLAFQSAKHKKSWPSAERDPAAVRFWKRCCWDFVSVQPAGEILQLPLPRPF